MILSQGRRSITFIGRCIRGGGFGYRSSWHVIPQSVVVADGLDYADDLNDIYGIFNPTPEAWKAWRRHNARASSFTRKKLTNQSFKFQELFDGLTLRFIRTDCRFFPCLSRSESGYVVNGLSYQSYPAYVYIIDLMYCKVQIIVSISTQTFTVHTFPNQDSYN